MRIQKTAAFAERMKSQSAIFNPGRWDQYAGSAQAKRGLKLIAESAKSLESTGFDATTTPEAGHDPYLPLMITAEHTESVRLGTNIAVAFPRSPMITAQIAWDWELR